MPCCWFLMRLFLAAEFHRFLTAFSDLPGKSFPIFVQLRDMSKSACTWLRASRFMLRSRLPTKKFRQHTRLLTISKCENTQSWPSPRRAPDRPVSEVSLTLDENFVLFWRPAALPEGRIKMVEPSLATLLPDTSLDAFGYLRPTRHFFCDALDDFLVFIFRPRAFHGSYLSNVCTIDGRTERLICYGLHNIASTLARVRQGSPHCCCCNSVRPCWTNACAPHRGFSSVNSRFLRAF